MVLQQIDLDTIQSNGKRGAPGRTAMTIVNQNTTVVEQRLSGVENSASQVMQALASHEQRFATVDGQVVELQAGLDSAAQSLLLESTERKSRDSALEDAIYQNLGRNRLINGNFDIWQRGTSFSAGYTADRWFIESSGVTAGVLSRAVVGAGNVGFITNPVYCAQIDYSATTDAAAHYFLVHQKVEDVRTLAGRNSVLSFTVFNAGSAGRQIAVEFLRHFGTTGASASESGLSVKKITLSAGFNYVEVPVLLPPILGKTITANSYVDVAIWVTGGSNYHSRNGGLGAQVGMLLIGEVQWEAGVKATEFEWRSYGDELSRCERYYEVLYMIGASGSTFTSNGDTRCARNFRTKKRVNPAVSFHGSFSVVGSGADGNIVNVIIDNITSMVSSTEGVRVSGIGNGPSMSGAGAVVNWADNGQNVPYIRADSEL